MRHFTFRIGRAVTLSLSLSLCAVLAAQSLDAHAAEGPHNEPAAVTGPDLEDDAVEDGDDGSSALPAIFKVVDPEDVEEITLEEEQALLGDWGDSDAEDGD